MVQFIDTDGNTFIALADISFIRRLNGEKSISGTIYTNNDVLHRIDRGWQVEFENEKYYLTYAMPTDHGNNITVEFDAIHEFFFKMGKSCIYDTLNGSNTAKTYLDFIFKNSGYTYSLATTIPAFEKENFGMKNRLALFNDFINSTNTEFQIIGNDLYIVDKIGNDLSTIVRKGFNMQELGLEHNISNFVTYAKGFGAFKDPDDVTKGRLIVEYTSPLAEIYGKLEADPVVDERYTKEDSFLEHLKEIVESSYSISVNLTVEDLRKAGYQYGLPEPGDYIMAVNEQLGFQQKIRIVGVDERFNVTGDLIENNITCNSINLIEQKNKADASNSKNWSDIANGVKPIPEEWLTDAIQRATSDLINSQSEVKYTEDGILAVDKNNGNRIVILNSAGIGVTTDGGKSFENAITADGVNATAINTGILKAIAIEGVTINGSTISGGKLIQKSSDYTATIENGTIIWKNNKTNTDFFKIRPGGAKNDTQDQNTIAIQALQNDTIYFGKDDDWWKTKSSVFRFSPSTGNLNIDMLNSKPLSSNDGGNVNLYAHANGSVMDYSKRQAIELTLDASNNMPMVRLGTTGKWKPSSSSIENSYSLSMNDSYINLTNYNRNTSNSSRVQNSIMMYVGNGINPNSTYTSISSSGAVRVSAKNFTVSGTKNATVRTENYGDRLLNAYETPECYFADYGEAVTDDSGKVKVNIDPIFSETIVTTHYMVFLTPTKLTKCAVIHEDTDHFVIQTEEPNVLVRWNIVAHRLDYQGVRLDIDETASNSRKNNEN